MSIIENWRQLTEKEIVLKVDKESEAFVPAVDDPEDASRFIEGLSVVVRFRRRIPLFSWTASSVRTVDLSGDTSSKVMLMNRIHRKAINEFSRS